MMRAAPAWRTTSACRSLRSPSTTPCARSAAPAFAGANVTIPHKQAALELATSASAAAREIGAANTLTFGDGGEIAADNTDAPGLLAALGEPPPVVRRSSSGQAAARARSCGR